GSMVAHLDGEPGRSLLWLAVGQPCRRIFLPYRVAEWTSQEELEATLRVEALLEERFAGAAGDKREGDEEAEHRLLHAVRAMEKELIEAVRDASVPLAALRAQTLERLERIALQ